MIRVAMEAAREAGRFLKLSVGKVRNVQVKLDQERNLVSEIDRGAEEKIISIIHRHYPSHAILAEESGGNEAPADYKWIIDPLDGTTNFLHGVPIFCVSIGIERKGEVIAGVVYDSNLDEMFTAEKGAGAFLNGKRMKVSSVNSLRSGLLVTGFPYNVTANPNNIVQHFNNFLMTAQGMRRLGSAAMDLAYVAAGRFEGFYELVLNPWDMAAGALFVTEAGGRVSNMTGAPLDIYGQSVVASNGLVHDEMLAVLRSANR
jgi:myo-inositol-1(or 4)-monophosphatase